MERLTAELDALKRGSFISPEEEERLASIEAMHSSVEAKYNKG